MITPKNIVKHELIGLIAEVADSSNPDNNGIMGTVADETKNTLVIRTEQGERTVTKDQCTFIFQLETGEKVKVDGKLLVARPEDRIKKKVSSW
jgi:ribonuclease P protein subunit POP4